MNKFKLKIKFAFGFSCETTNILYTCAVRGEGTFLVYFYFYACPLFTKRFSLAPPQTSYTNIASIIHNGFRHPYLCPTPETHLYVSERAGRND